MNESTPYDLIVRLLARRTKLSLTEIATMTLTQAMILLDDADPNDPHTGQRIVQSEADLAEILAEWESTR